MLVFFPDRAGNNSGANAITLTTPTTKVHAPKNSHPRSNKYESFMI
jgi:hypothetical protein